MNWNDLEYFTDIIVSKGLTYLEQGTADFVVISSLKGALWNVDWIEFDANTCYAKNP